MELAALQRISSSCPTSTTRDLNSLLLSRYRSPISTTSYSLRRRFKLLASAAARKNQLRHSHFGIRRRKEVEEEEVVVVEEEEEEEEEEEDYATSTMLSLSSKPNRSMALLDDYEMEELDDPPDPNHRSGQYRKTP